MKKILLLLAFTTFGILNGFSQSKKNDLKLTISGLPLFGSSENFTGLNGFVIKPAIGYYISDKTSIELNFSYASMNDLKIGNINSYYNSYSFIPTLRNNFVNTTKLIHIDTTENTNVTFANAATDACENSHTDTMRLRTYCEYYYYCYSYYKH
jgi:hypothetical protein